MRHSFLVCAPCCSEILQEASLAGQSYYARWFGFSRGLLEVHVFSEMRFSMSVYHHHDCSDGRISQHRVSFVGDKKPGDVSVVI